MTDQHRSEQNLFSDSNTELSSSPSSPKPEITTVSPKSPTAPARQRLIQNKSRKRSSLTRPIDFPIMSSNTQGLPAEQQHRRLLSGSAQNSPAGSRSSSPAAGGRARQGSPGPNPEVKKGEKGDDVKKGAGGTVLGLAHVTGRGQLVRTDGKKTVDFWEGVTKLSSKSLQLVLSLAKPDQTYDMGDFIKGVSYQGFDRVYYIHAALQKLSVKHFCQFAIIGAIRGSNFTKIVSNSENVPQDLVNAFTSAGLVKTPKKKDHLTILRCTASIPHWCAYWMLRAGVPKKMEGEHCPAAIQFPGAASLPMSKSVRIEHIRFCQAFSGLLPGGSFNKNIYLTAMGNLIPVADIPQEIFSVLGVSSDAEARAVTMADVEDVMGKAIVKR